LHHVNLPELFEELLPFVELDPVELLDCGLQTPPSHISPSGQHVPSQQTLLSGQHMAEPKVPQAVSPSGQQFMLLVALEFGQQ
jgi:hypothetical protein